jgi:hypothetical protein
LAHSTENENCARSGSYDNNINLYQHFHVNFIANWLHDIIKVRLYEVNLSRCRPRVSLRKFIATRIAEATELDKPRSDAFDFTQRLIHHRSIVAFVIDFGLFPLLSSPLIMAPRNPFGFLLASSPRDCCDYERQDLDNRILTPMIVCGCGNFSFFLCSNVLITEKPHKHEN